MSLTHKLFDLSPEMKEYTDRKALLRTGDDNEYYQRRRQQLQETTTVYVGGLAFYTTEHQVELLFSSCGPIADIIMGLNRIERTPCGFCFVEYCDQASAAAAVNDLNGAVLDDRRIRVDWDVGNVRAFHRFWGRAADGGSVTNAYRQNLDLGTGGLGTNRAKEEGEHNVLADQMQVYSWVPQLAVKTDKGKPAGKKPWEKKGGGGGGGGYGKRPRE